VKLSNLMRNKSKSERSKPNRIENVETDRPNEIEFLIFHLFFSNFHDSFHRILAKLLLTFLSLATSISHTGV